MTKEVKFSVEALDDYSKLYVSGPDFMKAQILSCYLENVTSVSCRFSCWKSSQSSSSNWWPMELKSFISPFNCNV